ncbi:MAG: bifunctional phosphoribosyl-AMP cyclohydrolase/phosphoribosyl-ATP diphosphatase HisIE [Bacteroidetes bacterium]|nr:bifunctional phosphoribosyl-AMP cyclohydrolase/phosphoribosyl-ATP diphosphatase HisIE [Bacteroidota bacterium]
MNAPATTELDFAKLDGLLPAVVQDAHTARVLMLGFMNTEAYAHTLQTGQVTFFSRSKGRLWTKGETSGHFLRVVSIQKDCDNDTLLIRVNPLGPVCHTGTDTCWSEANTPDAHFLHQVEDTLIDRRDHPKAGSHTSEMFALGLNKIAQKFGEEAVEVLIEAKDDNKELFLNESADLLYRFLCLLAAKHIRLSEVIAVLETRHK